MADGDDLTYLCRMSLPRRAALPLALTTSFALVGGVLVAAVVATEPVIGSATPVTAPATVPVAKKKAACSVGTGVTAKQVVVVRSTGSRATVKACTRTASGKYVVSLGPYSGHVGRN